jgi:hypothetical protein
MKIEKMTKGQLLLAISTADQKLNDPKWVTANTKFMVGAIFVHRSKLKEILKSRL